MAERAKPLTPERLAERWDCTPAHVRNLCRRGALRHFRIGNLYRIPEWAARERSVSILTEIRSGLPRDTDHFLYFMQGVDGGPIKIGIATDPLARLYQMQSASPLALKILGCLKGGRYLERALHKHFAVDRLHFEWFSPSGALVNFIGDVLAVEGVPFNEYGKQQHYRPARVSRHFNDLTDDG